MSYTEIIRVRVRIFAARNFHEIIQMGLIREISSVELIENLQFAKFASAKQDNFDTLIHEYSFLPFLRWHPPLILKIGYF